jgi:hypothetical protein
MINNANQAVIGPGITGTKLPIRPIIMSKTPIMISVKSIFKFEVFDFFITKNKNV